LTSGIVKLMAIFFPGKESIDGLKNCRGSLEFLGSSNNAAARKMGLVNVE